MCGDGVGWKGRHYRTVHDVENKGVHYCIRDYGPDVQNRFCYHYFLGHGRHYYKNFDDSTFYDDGAGNTSLTAAPGDDRFPPPPKLKALASGEEKADGESVPPRTSPASTAIVHQEQSAGYGFWAVAAIVGVGLISSYRLWGRYRQSDRS